MNMSFPFDSLAFVKKLRAAGVPDAQAEAQAEVFIEIMDSTFATKPGLINVKNELQLAIENVRKEIQVVKAELKRDIEDLRNRLKRDIEDLRNELKRDIEELRLEVKKDIKLLERDMTIKMGLMSVGIITILGILIRFPAIPLLD